MSTLVSDLIGLADTLTQDFGLQVYVSHAPWYGDGTTYREPLHRPIIPRLALVDFTQKLRRSSTGEEILQKASVTFLRPISPDGAENRREPIDPRDIITLPNGYTGPILDIAGGLIDPATNWPYMVEVILG